MPRYHTLWLVVLWLWIATPWAVVAQDQSDATYSLLVRNGSMRQALEELVDVSGIDLAYSSELITGKRVFCDQRDVPAEVLLQCILKGSGLDFIRSSSGTYILIQSLKNSPHIGDLAGSITDLDSGAPLPNANVLLADASAGTTTNQDGVFRFPSLLSGMHQLIVTYVGYETIVDTVWIEAGQNNRTQIQLRSYDVSVGPIVIDGLEQRLPSGGLGNDVLSKTQLTELSSLGTPDVIQGASRITGIGIQQPLAVLHIQGSAGNEHVTLLDGAPVRNPVSMGRHLGAFSPLALQRLTVHKAGFGTQLGSNLTGYVAVDHDLSATQPYSAALMADPVSVNLRVKSNVALNNGKEGSFLAAFRTSNWDVYQDRSVQTLLQQWNALDPLLATFWAGEPVSSTSFNKHSQQPSINFSDLHLAGRLKLSPYQNLSASMYRADNRLASNLIAYNQLDDGINDLFILTQDRYSWLNWVGQVRHSWLLGAKSLLATQLKGSWHNSSYSYEALNNPIDRSPSEFLLSETAEIFQDSLAQTNGAKEGNIIREYIFSSTLSHSFSATHNADIGIEASYVDSRFDFSNTLVDTLDYNLSTWQLAGFFHDAINLSAMATLEPGVRVTYIPLRKTVYAEPRISLRIDGHHAQLGNYALRFASGIYRQFINQFDLTSLGTTSAVPAVLFWLPNDETLAPPRAVHFTTEALLKPSAAWSMGVEAYMKWQPRRLIVDYARIQDITTTASSSPLQNQFITATNGRAYGANVHVKRHADDFAARIQYGFSLAEQKFPGRFNDATIASPWNVPHRLAFDTQTRLAEPLHLELNWISEWGRRWAFRRAYYDFLGPRNIAASLAPFRLDAPQNDIVPAYHRLDLGISYKVKSGRFQSDIKFFVVNMLDRENVYDQRFEPGATQLSLVPRALPGRQYSLSVRVDY